jgi:hypothetical protein
MPGPSEVQPSRHDRGADRWPQRSSLQRRELLYAASRWLATLGLTLMVVPAAHAQRCDLAWSHFGLMQDRVAPAMASDTDARRIVLFGGTPSSNVATWEWFGSAWHHYSVAPTPLRYAHAMAYDAAHHRTVMFGGLRQPPANSPLGDTWAWDSPSRTWTLLTAVGPSARSHSAIAYDTARQRLVLFGGDDGAPGGDTWEWVGAGWALISPGGVGEPSARWGHAMVYDAARQQIVLFGGYDGEFRSDTWVWDGTRWTQVSPGGPLDPPPRRNHSMAYDAGRMVTVLVGGWYGADAGDTWEWDGTAWRRQDGIPGQPPAGSDRAMAYDPDYGGAVLLGSFIPHTDTWRLSLREPVRINHSPVSRAVCPHTQVAFGVAATGYEPLQFQWRHNGIPLPGGPYDALLVLEDPTLADAGLYDVVVSDGCTSATSAPASLSVWATDFTGDGRTDIQDFLAFLQFFASGHPRGDFNGDGSLNVQDFLSFLWGFASGC